MKSFRSIGMGHVTVRQTALSQRCSLSLLTTNETTDSLVDVSCNDIFLGLDLTARLILGAQKTLKRFRDLGVEVYFVVYDVLLVDHPEWFSQGASQRFICWLETVSELSTGLVCISQATAEAVKDWLLYFPPLASRVS